MKRLTIKRYRSIREFETELGPGLNVFVGETDTGKSNVVRAIRDAAFNATGSGHVMAGEKTCEVMIDKVRWVRGDKANQYIIGDEKFEAVGKTSPDAVKRALGIDETEWGDGSTRRLQFIDQFGSPKFMLEMTGPANARVLGRVSGVERVYTASKRASADRRELQGRDKFVAQEIEALRKSLDELPDVDGIESKRERIVTVIGKMKVIEDRANEIERLVGELDEVKRELNGIKAGVEVGIGGIDVDELGATLNEKDDIRERFNTIRCVWEELRIADQKIKAPNLDGVLVELVGALKLKSDLNDTIDAMRHVESDAVKADEERAGFIDEADALKMEIDDRIDSEDVCPLTGRAYFKECKTAMKERAKTV